MSGFVIENGVLKDYRGSEKFVKIPNSVTEIGEHAFYDCKSLTSIEIPNSVTSIGNDAFYGCTSLTSIEIPNSVISIGDYAFEACTRLKSVVIGDGVTSIGIGAFWYCCLESIAVGANNTAYKTIDGNLYTKDGTVFIKYADSKEGVALVLPNGVKSIADSAFYGCDGLTSIVVPDSVINIEYQAFYGCGNLTSVTIGKGVTSIGIRAFYGCRKLTAIILQDPNGWDAGWNVDETDPSALAAYVKTEDYSYDDPWQKS